VRALFGVERLNVSGVLRRVNTVTASRAPLSQDLRAEINQVYSRDRRFLEDVTSADLSGWGE
jgi:hypothetical protein